VIARPYFAPPPVQSLSPSAGVRSPSPLWRGCLETLFIVVSFVVGGIVGAAGLERAIGSGHAYPGLRPVPHLGLDAPRVDTERPETPA